MNGAAVSRSTLLYGMNCMTAEPSDHESVYQWITFRTKPTDSGPLSQRATIAKVRCHKDPHMQNNMRKLTLTLTLTLTDSGGAVLTVILGYRSLYITWQ